jgi:hypothetical protein
MPQKFTTIAPETIDRIEEICDAENCGDEEFAAEIASLFTQFRMYQENRLKINKDSRESKMAARKEGGGGEGRSKSAKMTGVVKLVAIEGQENTFKVEKVSIPVPAPAPKPVSAEEEDNAPLVNKVVAKKIANVVLKVKKAAEPEINLAENPEALAAHLYSMKTKKQLQIEEEERADSKTGRTGEEVRAGLPAATLEARAQAEAWKKSEAERKKAEGIAKRKATLAAKKQELANAAKAALVANLKESESEDSGDETETDVETEDEE